ncbi:MAG: DUF3307 domain-containing protein [Bacteroidales bacterium]|nr:DUF3307 domain-containing protein [Bacteroidales bacterium]
MYAEPVISIEAIALFIRLLIAHLAGDFIFQRKTWIIHRSSQKWKSRYIYANAGIVAVLSWLLSGHFNCWLIPLLIFILHAGIDIAKSYAPDRPVIFAIDQILHLIATSMAVYLYLDIAGNEFYFQWLFSNLSFWTYLAAYLIVMWPMGIIIAIMTRKWQADYENGDGLRDAGRYIGMLERILILTFIFMNQFSAVGFLIAAKSVLRFGDIRDSNNRKGAEYILIGTMISLAAAIFTGLLTQWLLNTYLT